MTPQEAYNKCFDNNKRDKDLESIIIKSPLYASAYARDLIQGRWIEAENIISTNSQHAYFYVKYVIKGKLPENMHNAMILHADQWAKKYFNFIKNIP
jgi:hypothetical protein